MEEYLFTIFLFGGCVLTITGLILFFTPALFAVGAYLFVGGLTLCVLTALYMMFE